MTRGSSWLKVGSLYRQLGINSGGAALLLICTSLISQLYTAFIKPTSKTVTVMSTNVTSLDLAHNINYE